MSKVDIKANTMEEAILAAGLGEPGEIIEDGEIHRFETIDDSYGKQSGWYVNHGNRGAFGSWKTGKKYRFRAGRLTEANRVEMARRREAAKVDRAEAQEATKMTAQGIWRASTPQAQHSYLDHKGVLPHVARVNSGILMIPMYLDGALVNLQRIFPDHSKRFLPGGIVKGCYTVLDEVVDRAILCEGFATGASLHEHTGDPVIVCFTAGNLMAVAMTARVELPRARFIVAADNDHETEIKTGKNPGLEKGREAAEMIGARMIYPDFEDEDFTGTDFNDYLSQGGVINIGPGGKPPGNPPPDTNNSSPRGDQS